MCDGGIPGHFERAIPSALRHLVRTAEDRKQLNTASAECHPHHCGNRVASEEGIAFNEERSNRLSQRGPLDSRFKDTKRCCGNPVDQTCIGSVPGPGLNFWERRIPLSQRPQPNRTLEVPTDRLEKGSEKSRSSLFQAV